MAHTKFFLWCLLTVWRGSILSPADLVSNPPPLSHLQGLPQLRYLIFKIEMKTQALARFLGGLDKCWKTPNAAAVLCVKFGHVVVLTILDPLLLRQLLERRFLLHCVSDWQLFYSFEKCLAANILKNEIREKLIHPRTQTP